MTNLERKREQICYGLLIIATFATLVVVSQDAETICRAAASQTDCGACITAHPNCSWCGEVDKESTVPTHKTRCKLYEANLAECGNNTGDDLSYPTSSFLITEDKNFTVVEKDFFQNGKTGKNVIQLRPQEITVRLRPGHPIKVNVTFKKVIDYPLDLYYLMDLSNSMKDDLESLQELGTGLFDAIEENVTNNVQIGFGSFVDKVMMPFASTVEEQRKNPCAKLDGEQECDPAFGFRHQVNVTNNKEEFARAINTTKISGNIDSPEGSFDALMQIGVCDEIQWREGATHVILLTTDATPHFALDGKLAAILEANDMQCHMAWGANDLLKDSLVYSKSKLMDYPSVGQLRKAFTEKKIHTIFAVTDEVLDLYEKIRDVPNFDAYVEKLKSDSSNIIPLIKEAYDKIKGKLELSPPQTPDSVRLTYSVLCPNTTGWKYDSLQCDNIEINNTVEFEFELTATQCPSNGDKMDTIILKSSSLQDEVKITIDYVCDCGCASEADDNSTRCSNNGNLTCGVCDCEPGREGSLCQCESTLDGEDVSHSCKRVPSREVYCESNGNCECGKCQCYDKFLGEFCQCAETGCGSNENGICGGSNNGDCRNCDDDKRCECKNGFTVRETDGTCSCHNDSCKDGASNITCHGRGTCNCNRCVCTNTTLFFGEFCETCIHPDCTGLTAQCSGDIIRNCAECLYDADYKGETSANPCSEECGNSFLTYDYVDEFFNCASCTGNNCLKCNKHSTEDVNLRECSSKHSSTQCTAKYQVVWLKSNRFIVYVKRFNKETDCPLHVDPITIVLPVVASIILNGLAALIIWKVITTLRDRHQYLEFKKEEDKRKWTAGTNPIFDKPTSNFANPTFAGNAD